MPKKKKKRKRRYRQVYSICFRGTWKLLTRSLSVLCRQSSWLSCLDNTPQTMPRKAEEQPSPSQQKPSPHAGACTPSAAQGLLD